MLEANGEPATCIYTVAAKGICVLHGNGCPGLLRKQHRAVSDLEPLCSVAVCLLAILLRWVRIYSRGQVPRNLLIFALDDFALTL